MEVLFMILSLFLTIAIVISSLLLGGIIKIIETLFGQINRLFNNKG